MALGIEFDQIIGDVLYGLARLALRPLPFRAAQLIELRFLLLGADILLHEIDLIDRHGELIPAGIEDVEIVLVDAVDL